MSGDWATTTNVCDDDNENNDNKIKNKINVIMQLENLRVLCSAGRVVVVVSCGVALRPVVVGADAAVTGAGAAVAFSGDEDEEGTHTHKRETGEPAHRRPARARRE